MLLFSINPSTNSITTLILGGREYCECKEKGTSVYGLRHGPIDNTTPAFVGDNTNASGDMTKHSSSVHMYVATLLKETILIDVLVPMYSMAYYSCPLFVHRGMGSLQHINKYLEACNKG